MSPFGPWLATYPAGTVAERPWWSLEVVPGEPVQTSYPPGHVWQTVRNDGRVGIRLGYAKERGAARLVTEEVIAALDAIDAEHPRPVPPPMCGQVWAWPNGEQHLVGKVWGVGGGVTFANSDSLPPGMWPPFNAVLVSGPHAPWAPKGWRP